MQITVCKSKIHRATITGGDTATVILESLTVPTAAPNAVNLVSVPNVIIETSLTSKIAQSDFGDYS